MPTASRRRASGLCCWSSRSTTSSSTRSTRRSSARSPGTWATSPTSRSSGWSSGSAVREPMDGDLGRFYDAIENPREDPQRAADPARRRAALLHGRGPRSGRSRCSTTIELDDTDDPLIAGGFIYEMLIAHEHQHNETMLQLLQMVDGYEPVRIDGTVAGEPVDAGPEMVAVAGRRRTRSAPPTTASPTTTSARAHEVELAAFEIDRTPVTNARVRRVRRRRPAPSRRCTGSATAIGWVTTTFGRRRPLDPARGRSSTSTGIRPTPSPAGPASGCRPSSSGRRRRPAPTPTRANLDQLGFGTRAGGRLRSRGRRTAARCRCSATSGSGPRRTSPPTRGFERLPVPRVLRGLLRRHLQGPARRRLGDATRLIRTSFRNWDLPERSQIFSGHPLRKGRLNERMKRNASNDDG